MVPKSALRDAVTEVLEEHKLDKNKGLLDDLVNGISDVVEVFDDEESGDDQEEEEGSVLGE